PLEPSFARHKRPDNPRLDLSGGDRRLPRNDRRPIASNHAGARSNRCTGRDEMSGPREHIERTMTTWDGASLFYRAGLAKARAARAILLLQRGQEHSARWQDVIEELAADDMAVFAWDARGHGLSSGTRGDAACLMDVVKDVEAFVSQVSLSYGIAREDMMVVAHSVGAVVAAAWVHDYAPPIRGMVLATPAFRVRLYVPLAIPLLRLRQAVLGRGFVQSYVKARMLTHDALEAERYRRDPLIFRPISVNMLLDLHDTATRLLADAAAIQVPTLVLAAG